MTVSSLCAHLFEFQRRKPQTKAPEALVSAVRGNAKAKIPEIQCDIRHTEVEMNRNDLVQFTSSSGLSAAFHPPNLKSNKNL